MTLFFGYVFNLCSHYFYDFQKERLGPSGPYISTSRTKIINICLSVILEYCLIMFVARLQPILAYIHYTALEYLQKIPYFIPDYPNVIRFEIFEAVSWTDRQHCPMSEKISQR